MQPFQSVKAFANNIPDPGLREALLRIDRVLGELHASVGKLSDNKKANSSNESVT